MLGTPFLDLLSTQSAVMSQLAAVWPGPDRNAQFSAAMDELYQGLLTFGERILEVPENYRKGVETGSITNPD